MQIVLGDPCGTAIKPKKGLNTVLICVNLTLFVRLQVSDFMLLLKVFRNEKNSGKPFFPKIKNVDYFAISKDNFC